jgi:hypothetical protein
MTRRGGQIPGGIVLTGMRVRLLAVVAVLIATGAYAQEPPPSKRDVRSLLLMVPSISNDERDLRAAQTGELPQPPDPPAGPAAWSLTIYTTGGFTGQGVGSVTISSDGQLGCGSAPCATPVAVARLKPVSTAIASIIDAAWIRRTPSGLCRDCIQTTVVLKRREGNVVRTFVASWDDSQAASPEMRELRRLALDLRPTSAR